MIFTTGPCHFAVSSCVRSWPYAGKTWTEGGDAAISRLMDGPVKDMPVPFMGPPVLIDKKADFAIAEMPAIVLYLGETLDLMPATPAYCAP